MNNMASYATSREDGSRYAALEARLSELEKGRWKGGSCAGSAATGATVQDAIDVEGDDISSNGQSTQCEVHVGVPCWGVCVYCFARM